MEKEVKIYDQFKKFLLELKKIGWSDEFISWYVRDTLKDMDVDSKIETISPENLSTEKIVSKLNEMIAILNKL